MSNPIGSRRVFIEAHGIVDDIQGWAEMLGLQPQTLRKRLEKRGWSLDEALSTPTVPREQRRHNQKRASGLFVDARFIGPATQGTPGNRRRSWKRRAMERWLRSQPVAAVIEVTP